MNYKLSVDGEETKNNVLCWRLSFTTTMDTMKSEVTWWLSKDKLDPVYGVIKMYQNDILMFTQEFDPTQAPPQAGESPKPVDVAKIVGYETVTVTAGSFVNCMKVEEVQEEEVSDVWVHSSIPVWGIVKAETHKDSTLTTTLELISYGG
jgi:hypothetical protein